VALARLFGGYLLDSTLQQAKSGKWLTVIFLQWWERAAHLIIRGVERDVVHQGGRGLVVIGRAEVDGCKL